MYKSFFVDAIIVIVIIIILLFCDIKLKNFVFVFDDGFFVWFKHHEVEFFYIVLFMFNGVEFRPFHITFSRRKFINV